MTIQTVSIALLVLKKQRKNDKKSTSTWFQEEFYNELKKHPSLLERRFKTPILDEIRHITTRHVNIFKSMEILRRDQWLSNLKRPRAYTNILYWLDPSAAVKWSVSFGMFPSTVQSLGTTKHLDISEAGYEGKVSAFYT